MKAQPLSDELLALLCCPATHQTLQFLSAEKLHSLQLEAGLVREDGRVAYPIRDGIPILLIEEGIALP